MARYEQVPGPTIRRLSLYLRQLEAIQNTGENRVSSRQLGEPLRVTDAQVRKDLAYFGQFGRPGVGYRVDELIVQMRRILGTDRMWSLALVGAGNLGRALVSYGGFERKGFRIAAVFDNDETIIGRVVRSEDGLVVLPMSRLAEVVRAENTRIGIVAVPAGEAQAVAARMLDAGVQGILNFAPLTLRLARGVPVIAADLAVNLEQLSFQVRERHG